MYPQLANGGLGHLSKTAEHASSPFGWQTTVNAGIYGDLRDFAPAPVSFVQSRRLGTRGAECANWNKQPSPESLPGPRHLLGNTCG
jgi:hypothetical protein